MNVHLNGWQRLWLVMTVLWTITVSVLAWTQWSKQDASPVPPPGTDVTYLMNGVINANEHLTSREFAARIRLKYPGAYDDLTDDQLVTQTLEKYPYYRQFISDDTVNRARRRSRIVFFLVTWLVPPLGVYGLSLAFAWVRRGFRNH